MKKSNYIFALSFASLLLASCSSTPQPQAEATPVAVTLASPVKSSGSHLTVSGVLSAKNNAEISTRIMAYVDNILVKPGDQIKAGQLLIRLNANELLAKKAQVMAQIAEAEQATRNARRDFKRFQNLHATESVSDKELENMKLNKISMESRLQMAQQGLQEIEAMLAYTQIKAPFSGTVTQKFIDKGSMAKPGMPLLYLEQNHGMEVTATVPENYISQVKVGDSVLVNVKSQQRQLTGKISELSPSSSMSGGQYAMKVSLDSANAPQLRAGMYVGLQLTGLSAAQSPHLLIDRQALVQREQLRGVYVVNADSKAVLHWLRLGKSYGDMVEVLSGLSEHDRVILQAEGKLHNGATVAIK